MRKLIPIVLILIGLGSGVGAGLYLRPAQEAQVVSGDDGAPEGEASHEATPKADAGHDAEALPEYVKLSNQFVVPIVERERIASMVILSLSLEVTAGSTEAVFQREPKLRDVFLQMLFDHANTGGFRGSFTDAANLIILRENLFDAAHKVLGDLVKDVLITDIVRQDGQ